MTAGRGLMEIVKIPFVLGNYRWNRRVAVYGDRPYGVWRPHIGSIDPSSMFIRCGEEHPFGMSIPCGRFHRPRPIR